jgi:putative ABC transport system substrate-binding protein
MRRRDVLVLIGGAAVFWPQASLAQPVKRRRIAILTPGRVSSAEPQLFQHGLRALGYGDQLIEIRAAEGNLERLPDLAAELVQLGPEVVIAGGPAAVQAAKHATLAIPIVMVNVADPVGAGFVASLAHPGGNITGLANLAQDTAGKRLQLLKTAVPAAERIAVLVDPSNAGNLLQFQAAQEAAQTLGVELMPVKVSNPDEIDGAFAAMTREHVDALFVPDDPVFGLTAPTITELAASRKLPAIFQSRGFVAAGGLMSYGTNLNDLYGLVAVYVDKILKGAKPADLPVQQPTKFELVVNLKTAKALGLTVPQTLLARADEVIE